MAVGAVTQARIYVGALEFTSFTNQAEAGVDVATQDVTCFGTDFMTYVPGLRTIGFNTSGFNDWASGSLDEYVRTAYGTRRVTTIPVTTPATGGTAWVAYGLLGGKRFMNAAVGAVSAYAATLNGGIAGEGLLTQIATSSISATGHTTAVNVGALTAGSTIVAGIHVLSVAGSSTPTATFQLESASSSGGSYTLRGTAGSGLTAVGDQWLSTQTATTDAWWKLAVTLSGTSPVFSAVATIALIPALV